MPMLSAVTGNPCISSERLSMVGSASSYANAAGSDSTTACSKVGVPLRGLAKHGAML